jgi:hypothetical protein
MEETNQIQTATATTTPTDAVENFECIQCHKSFNSRSALAMHKVRVHTRKGILGARSGGLAAARAKRRAKMSEAMRRSWALRKRGKLRRRTVSLDALADHTKAEPRRSVSRARAKARNYQRLYYWKKRAEKGHQVPPDIAQQLANGTQPENPSLGTAPKQRQDPARGHINFCPHCGGDLQVITLALGMMRPKE